MLCVAQFTPFIAILGSSVWGDIYSSIRGVGWMPAMCSDSEDVFMGSEPEPEDYEGEFAQAMQQAVAWGVLQKRPLRFSENGEFLDVFDDFGTVGSHGCQQNFSEAPASHGGCFCYQNEMTSYVGTHQFTFCLAYLRGH